MTYRITPGPYQDALAARANTIAAELERLEREAAPLKAALFAATTHHEIASAADYERGWVAREAVLRELGPLMDAVRAVRAERVREVSRERVERVRR